MRVAEDVGEQELLLCLSEEMDLNGLLLLVEGVHLGLLHGACFIDPIEEEALVRLEVGLVDEEIPQVLDVLNP